ncbi:MAG: helix-turn-helix domain-containing protein [Oscillospiraceae bacterium]
MDHAEFIRDRITKLRIKKNISEYQMSLDLGHSKGYIQGISSGRALPSMSEFIAICEYFEITPEEFFSSETENPALIQKMINEVKGLPDKDIDLLIEIAQKFKH